MNRASILLPITGSQESLYAAEFAWGLAKKTGAKVTAQHVINTRGALEFIGFEKPGFIGSGPHIAAYETVGKSLRSIAEKLEESYNSRAASLGIDTEFVVDEGDPVEEICKRASAYSLIITGHHQKNQPNPDCQVAMLSLAEMLAHTANVPLFIVQEPIRTISDLSIFCSMDHVNTNWINNCRQSAAAIGATPTLTFLSSGQHEESPEEFIRNLKLAHPELGNTDITIVTAIAKGLPGGGAHLIAIPTIDAGDYKTTGAGQCPTELIRNVSFGAMLLWPEEYSRAIFNSATVLLSKQ